MAVLSSASNLQHGGRKAIARTMIFAAAFAGSSSIAAALKACETVVGLGREEAYTLDSTTSLSIKGFKASINYVTVPDAASRSIKILSASEEPVVELDNDTFTISTTTCEPSTESPTSVSPPTSEAPAADGSSWAVTTFSSNTLLMPLMGMFLPQKMRLPLLASYLLSSMAGFVSAQTNGDDACSPSIELEISVPYDCPYNNFFEGRCMTPRQIADMLVQALFVDFDADATAKVLAENYIQHNPTVPTGAAPVVGIVPILEQSGLSIEVHRTFSEGPLVAYHSTYSNATVFGGETLIGFDVFRVEDGKVQEHWDNLQERAGPNPSGNSMVDGPTMVKYLSETEANKELVVGLVQTVQVEGNFSAVTEFISPVTYTQHNPDIADGLEGLAEGFAALTEAGLALIYDSIELVVAEGNFVLVGSIGEYGAGNPAAYYDMLRVQDGLIVEHWDVIQSVPPPEDFAHTNGKF